MGTRRAPRHGRAPPASGAKRSWTLSMRSSRAGAAHSLKTAVNETIEYWLKGLGDGNDGRWPELTVELTSASRSH